MANPPKPWKAEYAKSGRSSCKTCKSPIGRDQLRLGKMVTATQFDGYMPVTTTTLAFFVGVLVVIMSEGFLETLMKFCFGSDVESCWLYLQETKPDKIVRVSSKAEGHGARGISWHHVNCFTTMSPSTSLEKISGWDSLSPQDKESLSAFSRKDTSKKTEDQLKIHVVTAELREMLEANGQDSTGSEYDLRDHTSCLIWDGEVDNDDSEMRKARLTMDRSLFLYSFQPLRGILQSEVYNGCLPLCRRMKLPIVRVDYLQECMRKQKKLPFDLYKIETVAETSRSGIVTVKVKGRSAVHEASGLQDTGHILEDGKSIYNTTLNMSDLSTGINRSDPFQQTDVRKEEEKEGRRVSEREEEMYNRSIGGRQVRYPLEKVKVVKMLEALQDIEIASRLVCFDGDDDESLDDKYKKLRCDITPLLHDSEDYQLIEKYLLNTHAPTHKVCYFSL
ncbi:hypothetical protein BHE74_00018199 [Ensete ventricosum]|nr:hypothetical protein BHE74_00018199 [Ensete ventricosum]RZR97856.1 hypothetical protein BHM03_00027122 [Ensete ventricosum]